MDTVETKYKARIEELERRDPTAQLKATTNEITKQIAYHIKDTTHLLETNINSWSCIEQIEIVEEVHKKIWQIELEIVKLKEETLDITPVQ